MKIYFFDGNKITLQEASNFKGKKLYTFNQNRFAISNCYNSKVPDFLELTLSKSETDCVIFTYNYTEEKCYCDPDYADGDDFYFENTKKKFIVDSNNVQDKLFAKNKYDLEMVEYSHLESANFKPNRIRLLIDVNFVYLDRLIVDKTTKQLEYGSMDLSLKKGDIVITQNGRSAVGKIVEVLDYYYELYGREFSNSKYKLVKVIKYDKEKYDLLMKLKDNAITHIVNNSKRVYNNTSYSFLQINFENKITTLICENINELKNKIIELNNSYINQDKQFSDISSYYYFHNDEHFKNKCQFILYTITTYYSIAQISKDVTIESLAL